MKEIALVKSVELLNSGETARAVAFDWLSRQLYVVGKAKSGDSAAESGFIQVFSVRPSESSSVASVRLDSRLVIIQSGLQEPKAIAVDPRAGYELPFHYFLNLLL